MLHLRPITALPDDDAIWPEVELKSPSSAFSERPPLRQLIVAADADLIDSAVDFPPNDFGSLAGLLSHDYITVLRYSDDGQPDDVARLDSPLALIRNDRSDDSFLRSDTTARDACSATLPVTGARLLASCGDEVERARPPGGGWQPAQLMDLGRCRFITMAK